MKESSRKKDKDEIIDNKKDKFDDNENKDYEEAFRKYYPNDKKI